MDTNDPKDTKPPLPLALPPLSAVLQETEDQANNLILGTLMRRVARSASVLEHFRQTARAGKVEALVMFAGNVFAVLDSEYYQTNSEQIATLKRLFALCFNSKEPVPFVDV